MEMEWDNPGTNYIRQAIKELGIEEDAAIRAFGQANLLGAVLKGQNDLADRVMERALALREADKTD